MPREFNHIRFDGFLKIQEIYEYSDSYTKNTLDSLLLVIYGMKWVDLVNYLKDKDLIIEDE